MKSKLLFASICIMLCGIWIPSVSVSADELEEKVVYLTDEERQEMIEQMIGSMATTFATRYPLDWTVPANKMVYGTDYFYKEEGKSVIIDADLSKKAMIGIIGVNGIFQYVEGKSVNHVFNAKTSQFYCICVNNKQNDSSVDVDGYYYR